MIFDFISQEQKDIVLDKSRIKLVNGCAGGHKCLGKNTPVLMFDGTIKLVQDIKVGDQLMGDDSLPRNVLEICNGVDELYEIRNVKKESYVVNKNHILSLTYSNKKSITHRPERHSYQVKWFDKKIVTRSFHYSDENQIDVLKIAKKFFNSIKEDRTIDISVQDYINAKQAFKNYLKGYKVKVDFVEKRLPLEPYMLGLWLGDGCSRGRKFTNQDAPVLKYLRDNLISVSNYDYYISSTEKVNYFSKTLRNLGLIKNKHIPELYKINSRENRLKLLAGIIDSDGHVKNNIYWITQKSEKLFDDIVFLCQSLGFACHKRVIKSYCYYKGQRKEGIYFTAAISGTGLEEIPTLCKRKRVSSRNQIKDVLVSGITVNPIGRGEYYGFEIDGNRRFLLGDFTVTHNTSSLIKCGMNYLSQNKNVIFLTKISSVTDEITKRMKKDYALDFTKTAGHFIAPVGENWCSVANFDSFIDKQLREYNIPFEGEAFNQKVKQLSKHMDKMTGIVMKNGQKIDVVLIDEVQDFDKLRVMFTTQLFNHFQNLHGVFVGDTLQTVFIQSIMGESFSMNYIKSNLDCKYFELSTCYRCPNPQIDFVNKVMGPYQEKYCLKPMRSNNNDNTHKPVLFQHHSVHKEYERSDLCRRVIYIIGHVLDNDPTINPDDIVVVMNKTNSNAVFEKLLVEINQYYKSRFNCRNYEHVIHYKTKNHEGRKTIDWSIGEQKTKFISIHGIKGKGQKVVILLGMSEKSIPMVEWLFKTEELVSQSVMNVALTRSERYLFVGVNSIPSRYIHHQMEEIERDKMAYCTWNPETYSDAPDFYKMLLTGFEQFEKFNFITDKYTTEIVSAPSKSVLAIKEDIVQEYHISDCIANAFQLMSPEIMTKEKFGSRFYISSKMNIVERAILGTMAELLVGRYTRQWTKNTNYDNKFLLNYLNDKSNYYFTNHQGLLNIVFDTKLNNFIKNPERWYKAFAIVKAKTKHIKKLREDLAKITGPTYILDNAFQKMDIRKLLSIYFSDTPNEQIKTTVFWNVSLFYCALSGYYKMVSVMMYVDSFNKDISALLNNIKWYCHNHIFKNLGSHNIIFQKQINILKKISDPEMLSKVNPQLLKENCEKKEYTYGIMGVSDIVLENKSDKRAILHELKCISLSDSAKVKTWVFQSVLYSYLLKKLHKSQQNNVEEIVIINLLSGAIFRFDMTKILIKYRDMITYIMRQKHFPELLITNFLERVNPELEEQITPAVTVH